MTIDVRNEALTYRQDTPYSFFQDFYLSEAGKAGHQVEQRLERHNQEMRQANESREAHARRAFRESGVEYRVEPSSQTSTFTPPLWLNQLFATANRPGRVLSDLIRARFPLPGGVKSINVPLISTGTTVAPQIDNSGATDTDVADAQGSSVVAQFAGNSDWARQVLELSPPGAYLDAAIFQDMTEACDFSLETQLLNGLGSTAAQLLGVANVASIINVVHTTGSPAGSAMWPYFGQVFAQVADGSNGVSGIPTARQKPPECWLFRSARWAWLMGSEDTATRPYGINGIGFIGSTEDTPNPVGGLLGLPVFLDDAIAYNLGAAGNQDQVFALRPSDMLFFEGAPQVAVINEPGSGNLMVRLQLRKYAAAITNRRPQGIGVLGGTGFALVTGY